MGQHTEHDRLDEGERDVVVLLDAGGQPVGTAPRTAVHGENTPLHLAFSSYILDAQNRLLMTRRALSKKTWPGVWTNSCCGHPRPGESLEEAVRRRVREELGLQVGDVNLALPDFAYRAVDASGVVENEVCPVFVIRMDPVDPDPDRAEVAQYAWVDWNRIVAVAQRAPHLISPWSAAQIPQIDRWLSGSAPA